MQLTIGRPFLEILRFTFGNREQRVSFLNATCSCFAGVLDRTLPGVSLAGTWRTGYYKHFNWRTGYSNILIGDWVLQTYQFVFVLFVTTMRYEMLYNECGQAPIENESSVHCSD